MSNKQVPAVYRSIMTDVIDQIRPEFDQLGVEEAVLQELLRLWELRLAQSRAADFSQDERMAPVAKQFPMLSHEEAAEQTLVLVKQEEDAKAEAKKAVKSAANAGKDRPKGEDGEDEDDEDAINSDLDDEDEEAEDEEAADGVETRDFVIALYEKVQRTKNKWKVTLKDGLISVNGREYLFAKCAGEFEW
ncbi:hypothetical protein BMF94_2983 [Rhodotorula taiwanensis]|uniref:Uncharacterized protein n=1 Tax=Rhodotorula taiwanensis TaxID=741276 RepID=A0A2S5BB31_9BASI|nr:hypothetical protein BMF94_2983 [Rhodotorula taiwanensis]